MLDFSFLEMPAEACAVEVTYLPWLTSSNEDHFIEVDNELPEK